MMETFAVERSIWINAAPERVWEAITHADQIQKWWGAEDQWEISAREVGGTIRFGDPSDFVTAQIAVFDPPHQFIIKWLPSTYSPGEMYTTYLLTEENGGTRVTVRESGYETIPVELRQKRLESSTTGYENVLAGLKRYIEGNDE